MQQTVLAIAAPVQHLCAGESTHKGGDDVTENVVLKIDPALPCAILNGTKACDRPARMAYAYPTRGPRPGVWLIMPVCDRCAGTSKGLDADDDSTSHM
jgi:hypothetical protein